MCCSKAGSDGICKDTNGITSADAIPLIEKMLCDSIDVLNPKVAFETKDCQNISRLVLHSMQTSGRVYHNMQHVFDISQTMKDPILILSALFHDVIYYSIDKHFQEEQADPLKGVIVNAEECSAKVVNGSSEPQQLVLETEFTDPIADMVVRLYGFTPGDALPKLGTNEFLSAMIGVRVLEKWLSTPQLMQVATCIEATIPFRPISEDGKSPMDRLYDRLKLVCPDQSEEWLVNTVQLAAVTANCDLCSFDSDDRDFFLDSSWKLIPEARPTLLDDDCPLLEYYNECFALEGRTKFLKGAVPKIFQSFRQSPSDDQMAVKQTKTHENLKVMSEYALVRMLQLMVLVEFVKVMGEEPGSIPLRPLLRMSLPEVTSPYVGGDEESSSPMGLTKDEQAEVRNWLFSGRRTCFPWDPAISPLGAYLYDSLGPKGVADAVELGKNQKPGSHELLKVLPKDVVTTIASSLGAVLPDRADGFLEVPEKLGILAQ
jgi:hypothetical protein